MVFLERWFRVWAQIIFMIVYIGATSSHFTKFRSSHSRKFLEIRVSKFLKGLLHKYLSIFCLLIINHLPWFLRVSKIDLPETTILRHTLLTRLAFTCSKSTIEMLEQGVKSVKSYNEDTRITSVTPFWCLYC